MNNCGFKSRKYTSNGVYGMASWVTKLKQNNASSFNGEVAELVKAPVLKTGWWFKAPCRFESCPLRQRRVTAKLNG